MAGVIKSLKVTWDWTGDIYALKGFNVAITPEGSNPNKVTTAISRAGKDAFEHTFKDLVLEEGNYTAWVQAIYENIDSDWESAGGIIVEDDGTATITTYDQHKTLLDETASYRTPGPPSNNPVPTNISTRDNENGTLDITLEWAAYEQGERQADMIFLFYKKGDNKNLGAPTENDNAIIFNVNTGSANKHTIEGVAPNKYYSFGLAAGRRTENGIEIGKIQSPSSWQNVTIGSATINHDSVWATAGRGSVLINDSGLIGKKADGTITFQIDTDGEAYFSGKLIVGGEEVANISDLETQAGAQAKADKAKTDAESYAMGEINKLENNLTNEINELGNALSNEINNLESSLGDLAYKDLVEKAELGQTIIKGGHIRADLLTADNIVTGTLQDKQGKSYINLDDGKFGFADGKLTYDGQTLVLDSTVLIGNNIASNLETKSGAQSKADKAKSDAIQYADEINRGNVKIKPKGSHLWHFDKHLTSTDGIIAKII